MNFEMAEMKTTMGRMSETLSKVNAENQSRDRQFADLITKFNADIRTRDQRTDEEITRIEKNMDAKIGETSTPNLRKTSPNWKRR